jgi:hypothetical protein
MTEFFHTLMTLTLFGSVVWALIVIGLFIAFCFYSDVNENGFIATVSLIIFGFMFFKWGKESLPVFKSFFTWSFFIIYFSLGLLHAFIRVFFHGRSEMKKVNEYRLQGHTYEYNIDRKIKENIFRWWFMWPVSLIVWIISDMIKEICDFIYQKMSKVFDFIFNLGVKSVKEVPKNEKDKK